MTYYEELGISADAAEEEIRHAHRRLVKLLHPDQQLDAQLRRMAELQMTRVNTLVEQLLDPTQRKLYDLAIRHVPAIPPVVEWQKVPAESILKGWKLAWSGVAVALVAGLLSTSSPTDVVRSVTAGSTDGARTMPVEAAKSPAKAKPVAVEIPRNSQPTSTATVPVTAVNRKSASEVTQHIQSQAEDAPLKVSDSVAAVAPQHAVEAPRSESASAPQSSVSLSGVWLYAGGKKSEKDQGLYKPEYIELRISEDGGVMQGEYRSRYAVTDLPISPAVNFSFQGSAASSTLPWRGPKGSSGTVSLKLLNRNAIQVDWKVSDPGESGIGLEFGTGTLVRRL